MDNLDIKKGDIFWADLSYYGIGVRPVVIISNDEFNKYSSILSGVIVSSNLRTAKLPIHVLLPDELSTFGFVQTDKMLTFNKSILLDKIGNTSEDKNFIEKLNKSLTISFQLITGIELEDKKLKEYIKQLKRPLVITEGKTDVTILETAWKKLYPDKEMYFDCDSCGLAIDINKRSGGVVTLRQTLENLRNDDKPTIGLFDNDQGGNSEFNSLNKEIFPKHSPKYNLRKHITKNIWGMLLPVPSERELFVTRDDINQRYFVIEHYFPNEVLREHGMYGSKILGTEVFNIIGNKTKFAEEIQKLEAEKFKGFSIFFKEIDEIFSSVKEV